MDRHIFKPALIGGGLFCAAWSVSAALSLLAGNYDVAAYELTAGAAWAAYFIHLGLSGYGQALNDFAVFCAALGVDTLAERILT